MSKKSIHLHYYALLKEERGVVQETLETTAATALELYQELQVKYKFKLSVGILKVAINNEFTDWSKPLKDGDQLILIPPVAGG